MVEKVDVCFILESSELVREGSTSAFDYWALMKEFVSTIVVGLPLAPDGARVGVVTYANEATLEVPLNRYTDSSAAQEAIHRLTHMDGGADLPVALVKARTDCFNPSNGDRPNARNVAILMTTGRNSRVGRRSRTVTEAAALKGGGVDLMVFGVTDSIDYYLLREISSPPHVEGQNVFQALDFQAVSAVLSSLGVDEDCDHSNNGELNAKWISFSASIPITSNHSPFGCPIIYTDIYSQCYFLH